MNAKRNGKSSFVFHNEDYSNLIQLRYEKEKLLSASIKNNRRYN